jgi:hypothetical protein
MLEKLMVNIALHFPVSAVKPGEGPLYLQKL